MKESTALRRHLEVIRFESYWADGDRLDFLERQAATVLEELRWLEELELNIEAYDLDVAKRDARCGHQLAVIDWIRHDVDQRNSAARDINRKLARWAEEWAPSDAWPTDEDIDLTGLAGE